MRIVLLAALLPTIAHAAPAPRAAPPVEATRPVPYWATIVAGEARMRTGPGRQFPAVWLYRRAGLPVQVVQVAPGWRRVRDQEGAVGWMLVTLLSDQRSAVVMGGERPMRAAPEGDAKIVWRAQPGVVGRVSECGAGWCALDVKGRRGYIEVAHIWGVGASETVE